MHSLDPALVAKLASPDPNARTHAAVTYARTAGHCDAALLLCHKPDQPGYTIMVNDGYPTDVADYFAHNIDTMPDFTRTFRVPTTTLLSWEDTPEFTTSYSALEILQPAGFNNGMTLVLRDRDRNVVGALVVNMAGTDFKMDYKAPIGTLKPLFTDFAQRRFQQVARSLTRRESDVIRLMKEGRSNAEIGDRLDISPRTVATHVEGIFTKLGARTRVAAVVEADRLGFFDASVPEDGARP